MILLMGYIRKGAEENSSTSDTQTIYNQHTRILIFTCPNQLIKIYWCQDISINNVIKVTKNADIADNKDQAELGCQPNTKNINLVQMRSIRLFRKPFDNETKLDKFSWSGQLNLNKDP